MTIKIGNRIRKTRIIGASIGSVLPGTGRLISLNISSEITSTNGTEIGTKPSWVSTVSGYTVKVFIEWVVNIWMYQCRFL